MAVARYDIDDTKQGILAVDGAAGAGDKLDTLNELHVDRKSAPHKRSVVNDIVDAVAIDGQQYARIEIAGKAKTTCTKTGVLPVVTRVNAG